jgi:hypothetical protein
MLAFEISQDERWGKEPAAAAVPARDIASEANVAHCIVEQFNRIVKVNLW